MMKLNHEKHEWHEKEPTYFHQTVVLSSASLQHVFVDLSVMFRVFRFFRGLFFLGVGGD